MANSFTVIDSDTHRLELPSSHSIWQYASVYLMVYETANPRHLSAEHSEQEQVADTITFIQKGMPLLPGANRRRFIIAVTEHLLVELPPFNAPGKTTELRRLLNSRKQIPLNKGTSLIMKEILLRVRENPDTIHFAFSDHIKARYMKVLLLYIVQELLLINSQKSDNGNSLAEKYLLMVEANYNSIKSVAEYARVLQVSPNYLNKIVKKETGLTARQLIQNTIIKKARIELLHNRISLKELANQLGFGDSAHFSRFLKKISGLNFSEFKRSIA